MLCHASSYGTNGTLNLLSWQKLKMSHRWSTSSPWIAFCSRKRKVPNIQQTFLALILIVKNVHPYTILLMCLVWRIGVLSNAIIFCLYDTNLILIRSSTIVKHYIETVGTFMALYLRSMAPTAWITFCVFLLVIM